MAELRAEAVRRPAVVIEDDLAIPGDVCDLDSFRDWVLTDPIADRGRIDYVDGTIEVDMSPEQLQSHGQPKVVVAAFLQRHVEERDLGQVFVDRARLVSRPANLSCEPDVVFVSWEALESGRARYVPSSADHPDQQLEIEGAADIVVEVISRSSLKKDTQRLPPAYAKAGVRELWRVDARGADVVFEILHLVDAEYREVAADTDGFCTSTVLGLALRMRRAPGRVAGTSRYFIDAKPTP